MSKVIDELAKELEGSIEFLNQKIGMLARKCKDLDSILAKMQTSHSGKRYEFHHPNFVGEVIEALNKIPWERYGLTKGHAYQLVSGDPAALIRALAIGPVAKEELPDVAIGSLAVVIFDNDRSISDVKCVERNASHATSTLCAWISDSIKSGISPESFNWIVRVIIQIEGKDQSSPLVQITKSIDKIFGGVSAPPVKLPFEVLITTDDQGKPCSISTRGAMSKDEPNKPFRNSSVTLFCDAFNKVSRGQCSLNMVLNSLMSILVIECGLTSGTDALLQIIQQINEAGLIAGGDPPAALQNEEEDCKNC